MATIINSVLNEITPERVQQEINAALKVELPDKMNHWISGYKNYGDRNPFIWGWLWRMFQIVRIPITDQASDDRLLYTKVLLTLFICLLDDPADKGNSKDFLEELIKIPFDKKYISLYKLNKKQKKYLAFTQLVWDEIISEVQQFPKYSLFKEMMEFDFRQIFSAMRYSELVNSNYFVINPTEYWHFGSYNMVLFVYSDLDLMCSSRTAIDKIGTIREIIYEAQKMARVGNWVSTWERELKEVDFSSAVYAYAIKDKVVSIQSLKDREQDQDTLVKIKSSNVVVKIYEEWENSYHKIEKIGSDNKITRTTDQILNSLKQLLILHLTSRNYK